MRASQELATKAPNSYQAKRLEAESFESQSQWDRAAGIYREIIAENPKVPGLHYRLGQVLLSKAGDSGPVDDAKAEFEKELELDPHNASAEFVLGELARRAGDYATATEHFSRAAKLDVGFAEAYLAWGMSLGASGDYRAALSPLEAYVKMAPSDPAGHYQLGLAYARTGNRNAAMREMRLQQQAAAGAHTDSAEGHTAPH